MTARGVGHCLPTYAAWARYLEVQDAYGWNPGAYLEQWLAARGRRWRVIAVNHYQSTEVSWPAGS